MPKRSFTTYQLYFSSPLHMGDVRPEDYGSSERFLRSDTMHAAIIASLAKQGRPIPEDGDLGFFVSSLFPFTTAGDHTVHFFPKLMKGFNLGKDKITYAKKLKSLQWLDQHYFECQLNDLPANDFGGKDQPHLQGAYAASVALGTFMQSQVSQRVTIPRQRTAGEAPTPFYMERLLFKPNSGLYFIFQGNEAARDQLEAALDLLQYEGLGTDRTVGNGGFEYASGTLELQVPEEATYSTNLSLFCPENKEQLATMMTGEASYDFLKRGGWITTEGAQTYRKRAIYMFQEGSIFQTAKATAGRSNIDLSPTAEFIKLGHKVLRNGSSIFLPVKI